MHDRDLKLAHVLRALVLPLIGSEPLCDCVPAMETISTVYAEDSSHWGCHLPACARDQSSSHGCAELFNVQVRNVQGRCRVAQLGDVSQKRTT